MAEMVRKKCYEGFDKRMRSIGLLLILAFSVLGLRLWYLQIVRGPYFANQAEKNRLYLQRLKAARGIIYGRDERVILADNRAACDLVLVPAECPDPQAVCRRLAEIIQIDADALVDKIAHNERQPYKQVIVKRDVSRGDLVRVEERSSALPGVLTVVRPHRRYLHGKTAGQILGYLGEIGPEELERMRPRYTMGDLVGRAGIERMYEAWLHGHDGQTLLSVYASGTPQIRTDPYGKPYIAIDSFGRPLETMALQEPLPGADINLTLDIGLQAFAEQLLKNVAGAIVALDAHTGEVLALASAPGFDPSIFVTQGQDRVRYAALHDERKPMQHRGFHEAYPPGSVFKVLLAIAALEEGLLDEDTTLFCPGHFQLTEEGRLWRCWQRAGHRTVNVVDALAYSCDVFFYQIGLRLGVDRIHEWSQRLGLGMKTGIDLPGETAGLIPSQAWKQAFTARLKPRERWEQRWYDGDTLNMAIGQGAATTTPLQNALLMAVIVNGGHLVRPYLNQAAVPVVSEPLVSESTIRVVRSGLRKCVEKDTDPTGTGHLVKIPGMTVLGKTGTSQVVSMHHYDKYEREEDIPHELRDHALFIAGVLDREPAIAVSVLVEHGLHGSKVAAPRARQLIEYYYSHQPDTVTVARR